MHNAVCDGRTGQDGGSEEVNGGVSPRGVVRKNGFQIERTVYSIFYIRLDRTLLY